MNVKKYVSIFTATILLSTLCQTPFKANAEIGNSDSVIHGTGGIWEDFSDSEERNNADLSDSTLSGPPSSFDITTNSYTSPYFPTIGNQYDVNSCAGWATTYYQFTYEANMLKGTPTTGNNTYSPSWTYNYINGGTNTGTYLSDAYTVLRNQGAMYLVDYPHANSSATYSFTWSSDLPKMREALSYRATDSYLTVDDDNLIGISSVKSLIATGKVGVIWTDVNGWNTETNSLNNDEVIVRCSRDYNNIGGHFMAVVGYDDDYQITVNGQTLTGAFKLANSWGTSWGNNGYIWVSYDALLSSSAYGTNWQSNYSGIRYPIFSDSNQFHFIDVHYCDAYFTETLQFTSSDPWILNIYGKNGSYATTLPNYLKKGAITWANVLPSADTRYLVFDYTNPGTDLNVGSYLSTTWTLNMVGEPGSYNTYNIGARLTDNLGKEIEPFNNVYYSMNNGVYTQTHTSNIAKGRVSTYDNQDITMDDVDAINDYLLGYIDFSSLQMYLADYNNDGSVDMADEVSMLQHIYNSKGMSSIYDIIPGYDYSIADFIERELNISADDFVSTLQ